MEGPGQKPQFRLGIALQTDLLFAASDLGNLGSAVTQAGLTHVSVGDHVAHHGGYGIDGLIAGSVLASAHPHLHVVVGAFQLALRHPLVAARQVATFTAMAPGRLVLAVGAGGDDRSEVFNCGVDPATRGRRLDESVTILRRLLDGESVSVTGDHFELREARILDAGPPPPLIVAGSGLAAARRAALLGDGWLALLVTPSRFSAFREQIMEIAVEAGRPVPGWWGLNIWCSTGANWEQARDRLTPELARWFGDSAEQALGRCAVGTVEDVAETLASYLDAGANHLSISVPASTAASAVEEVAAIAVALRRPVA